MQNGDELYDLMIDAEIHPTSSHSVNNRSLFVKSFLSGWVSGYKSNYDLIDYFLTQKGEDHVETILLTEYIKEGVIDFPEDLTSSQIYDLVYGYLKISPEIRQRNLNLILLECFSETFDTMNTQKD